MASNLFAALDVIILFLSYIKYAYDSLSPLPTLPLIWYSWDKPRISALSIIKVLAFGISIPVSIIVVHIKIS